MNGPQIIGCAVPRHRPVWIAVGTSLMLPVVAWVFPGSSYADGAPTPRPPLLQQFNMPVGNVARVSNLGNQALSISYLNGAINLAFNNGKVLIQTVVLVGFNYELFWSDQTSTWEIHPSAPVQ